MASIETIFSESPSDCFWLCDGTLKDIPWSRNPSMYFGSAAVNAASTTSPFCQGGSVGPQNTFKFKIQEAELMSIMCAAEGAMTMPRENIIIVTDDHSRDQYILKQVVKTWTNEEMSLPVYKFRLPIVGYIRHHLFTLLTDLHVQSIILTDVKTLHHWRPELAMTRKRCPTSRESEEEWEPHWVCAEVRDKCAQTLIEQNMFGGTVTEILDYTAILPNTPDTISGRMVALPFGLPQFGRGYRITLQ